MTLTVLVHEAEEGGYWAEVPELPGCASRGETLDALERNVVDAVQAWMDVYIEDHGVPAKQAARKWELAIPDRDAVTT